MKQINVDEDAHRILVDTKKKMRENGITGASLSDAIRELAREAARHD